MVKKEKKFILYCLTKTTGRELTRPKRVGEYNHPFGAENQARVKLEYHRRMEFKILDCWTRKTWKINHLFKPNFPLQIYNEPWEWQMEAKMKKEERAPKEQPQFLVSVCCAQLYPDGYDTKKEAHDRARFLKAQKPHCEVAIYKSTNVIASDPKHERGL